MDYQTFTTAQQGSFGGGFGSSAHSPQNTLHPQAQFQQSNPSFPYGQQFPNGQGFPSTSTGTSASPGGMVGHGPTSGAPMNMMQPMQPGGMQRGPAAAMQSYSNVPSSFQHQQQHQQHQNHQNHHTASPSSNNAGAQSYAAAQMQQSPGPAGLVPNGQQPGHPVGHVKPEPSQVHTPVKATVPPSPVSPVAQARTQDRVATLLEINSILIKEVCDLQTQGKAGQVGQSADGKPDGDKPPPAKEYVDYMRRLQANLAYLAQNAEKNPKPGAQIQPGPAIMSVPASHSDLAKLYQKLIELFPGWKGQTAQMKQSPGPHRMNSTASNASQPPNSAGLQQNWGQNAMANMQQAQAQAQAKMEP